MSRILMNRISNMKEYVKSMKEYEEICGKYEVAPAQGIGL